MDGYSFVEPLVYAFVFGLPILITSIGGVSIITSIPLLAVGINLYEKNSSSINKNLIISGGICLGLGSLFFIPAFIILMYNIYRYKE